MNLNAEGMPKWCENVPPAYRQQAGCTGGAAGSTAGALPTQSLAAAEGNGNPKWCDQVPPGYAVQAGCTGGLAGGLPGAPPKLPGMNLNAEAMPKWCENVPPAYRQQAGCTGGAAGSTAGAPPTGGVAPKALSETDVDGTVSEKADISDEQEDE